MEKDRKIIREVIKKVKPKDSNEDSGSIKIKQNRTKYNIKKSFKLISIVLIATLSGAVGGVYFIQRKYGNNISMGNKTIFQVINRNDTAIYDESIINKAIKQVAQSIVSIGSDKKNMELGNESELNGSGVIIKNNGYIVTNYSLVNNSQDIFVKLSGVGSKPFKAELIGSDIVSDLAVVKIDTNNLPVAKFADTDLIKPGDQVIAVGNSEGDDYIGFVTFGEVNSKNKKIEVGREESADKKSYKVIQTRAIIEHGNTGGALLNVNGEVVGINSRALTQKYLKNSSFGYALEIKEAQKIIDSILNYGKVKRVRLGFDGASITSKKDEDIEGVYVKNVERNGSAAKAGMRPTDIIVEIDGKNVKKLEDILSALDSHKIGDTIPCKVLRDGEKQDLSIVLLENK